MAGLWSVRECGPYTHRARPVAACPRRGVVRPPVRSSPAIGGGVPWLVRGSARCTGSSGLGDTATFIPAGGGPVREAMPASRTVRVRARARVLRKACTERAQVHAAVADLAENRPHL